MDAQSKNSLVSVIMPVFNSETTVLAAVNSVLKQTHKYIELLIVNDYSTDDSVNILTSIKDTRVKILFNTGEKGVSFSRNIGISEASGRYIAFIDSDDLWYPEKLELQINEMKNTALGMSHGSYDVIDGKGFIKYTRIPPRIVKYNDLVLHNHIGNLTGIYDRTLLGKFYQKSLNHEDYAMWLEIMKNTDSCQPNRVLGAYRTGTKSLSSNKIKNIYWHYKVLKQHGFSIPESIIYTTIHLFKALKRQINAKNTKLSDH